MKPSIDEIKGYIYSNIADFRSIKELAEHFHTTAPAVKMAWKRSHEAISLGRFIAKVRITAAESWYRSHPDAPCKQIAGSVGFRRLDSGAHFFKRRTGRSMKKHFDRE